ncbi:MAG: hypothetical protein LBB58_04850 [Cellulomonadaceae bacterium]|nr:hypothetical protein [Cellulomonadaceae bacterium]
MKLSAAVEVWLANPNWSASTLSEHKSIATHHILPRRGDMQPAKITHDDVQIWTTELAGKMSASRVKRVHGVLSSILNRAIRPKHI